jgi:hypothetical protein
MATRVSKLSLIEPIADDDELQIDGGNHAMKMKHSFLSGAHWRLQQGSLLLRERRGYRRALVAIAAKKRESLGHCLQEPTFE